MRSAFHQSIRAGHRLRAMFNTFNCAQIVFRELRRQQHVVYVIPVTTVGRNPSGGGMRLFEKTELFQLRHYVPNCGRTPTRAVSKLFSYHMRAYSFSGREMLLDNARKDYLASGLWFWPFGFAWILSSGHACHTNRTILVSPSITNSAIFPQLLAAFGLDALKRRG